MMYIMIGLIFVGFLLGRLLQIIRKGKASHNFLDSSIMWVIYLLLFFLGISIGENKQIIQYWGSIGYEALLLSIGGVLGSVIFAKILYNYFFKK